MFPVSGKWESFLIKTVDNPLPGVEQALVIAGSDKRGTILGFMSCRSKSEYHLGIGGLTLLPKGQLYVKPGSYVQGEPLFDTEAFLSMTNIC